MLQSPPPFSPKTQGTTRTTKMPLVRSTEPVSLKGRARCRRTGHTTHPARAPGEPPGFGSSCHIKANTESHRTDSGAALTPLGFDVAPSRFSSMVPPQPLPCSRLPGASSSFGLRRCDITLPCHGDSSDITAHGGRQTYPLPKHEEKGRKQGKGRGWRGDHRIMESLRLEKPSKVIESYH